MGGIFAGPIFDGEELRGSEAVFDLSPGLSERGVAIFIRLC